MKNKNDHPIFSWSQGEITEKYQRYAVWLSVKNDLLRVNRDGIISSGCSPGNFIPPGDEQLTDSDIQLLGHLQELTSIEEAVTILFAKNFSKIVNYAFSQELDFPATSISSRKARPAPPFICDIGTLSRPLRCATVATNKDGSVTCITLENHNFYDPTIKIPELDDPMFSLNTTRRYSKLTLPANNIIRIA